jgi:hypothetical protein
VAVEDRRRLFELVLDVVPDRRREVRLGRIIPRRLGEQRQPLRRVVDPEQRILGQAGEHVERALGDARLDLGEVFVDRVEEGADLGHVALPGRLILPQDLRPPRHQPADQDLLQLGRKPDVVA